MQNKLKNYLYLEERTMLQLKIPPPVYALGVGFAMWTVNTYSPIIYWIASPWNKIGLVIIGLSFLLESSSLLLFLKKKTTPNPFKPENTNKLVTSGLYKYTRNPMYVGLLIILLGYAIWLGSATPFMVVPLFCWLITNMQIKPEEKILEEKFGQEYLDYKNKVKRWF